MKPIKTIAGDLLLFFYAFQRKTGSIEEIIEFDDDSYRLKGGFEQDASVLRGKALKDSSLFAKGILEVSANSSNDAYNAMQYLKDKGFIFWRENDTNMSELFHGLRVTAGGTDIIEGIERGEKEKNEFNVTFNIKVADTINVESLIKMQLESLVKPALLNL